AGNILNQGNTLAQFSKISINEQQIPSNVKNSNNSSTTNEDTPKENEVSEYIGDLPVNQPIPFNMPIPISQLQHLLSLGENSSTNPGYPRDNTIVLPVKLTYTDSIQKVQEIVLYKSLPIDP